MSESESDEEFFEVDKIVDHRTEGRKIFYKVRWKGYAPSQDTWEPHENLGEGCEEVVDAYFEQKKQKAEAEKPKQKKKGTAAANIPSPATSVSKTTPATETPKSEPVTPASTSKSVIVSDSSTSQDDCLSPTDVFSKGFPTTTTKLPETSSTSSSAADCVLTSGFAMMGSLSEEDNSTSYRKESAQSRLEQSITQKATTAEPPSNQVVPAMTSTCKHQPEYDNKRTQDYRMMSQRYEVRGQVTEGSSDQMTNSRRCITVLMSRLCDPDETDLFGVITELQNCMRVWNQSQQGSDVSLISAILTQHEGVILQNKETHTSSINRAIPGNWTPLHFAAAVYKFDVCEWLLDLGCWPDIVNISKETPLSLALKHPESKNYRDKLLSFVNKLISHGVNVSHTDSAMKVPIAIAKKNKCHVISAQLTRQQQRLRECITSLMVTHLDKHPDNLYLKDYFLEPQLITQPPGVTYTITFKFKAPTERCVARLTLAYCRNLTDPEPFVDVTEQDVHLHTDAPFPFITFNLNNMNIVPINKLHLSVNLKSELQVGNNVLEIQMSDNISNHADSVLLFGCLIAKSQV